MSAVLRGLFCPLTTPFDDDGRADAYRLSAQLSIYSGFDLAGVVLFGTSGEGALLDDDEQDDLLAAARRALPAGRALVVQVGRESTAAAAVAAARAVEAGADALLCLPPRYYPVGEVGLAGYFRAVAAAAGGRPLLAYHIPQRSHVDLPADLLVELAAEGTLAGIKESAGDLDLQAELRRRAGPAFAVLNGRADATAAALRGGADGAVLAVADAAPETCARLLAAVAAGDDASADAAQESLEPLAAALGPRWGVPGIKAALDVRRWPGGGPPRPPLLPLGPEARAEIADALRDAGIDLP
ncbi:MAG TPA: dihydrodipicolinate synthase family protein [Gemmatimonadota bacterium]|nr:dihydrodipicolinate synthase family protein [Gemmatimonadota bacterium]